jgi:DNA helicase II / ATP-dependent DNA helicase PcrA
MDVLQNLNQRQQQAVTAPEGQILVLAGPGSGKTRVLTRRIAYLVQYMGVSPFYIMAVTFTNKAAREMKSRVETMIGESIHGMWLGTFHANCARILRREAAHLPISNNYIIFDADDQVGIIKNIIKEEKLNDKQYRPYDIQAAISNAKNNLITADEMMVETQRDRIVQRVYRKYQATLESNNAVDFDDLLFWAVRLFEEYPAVREAYARQFRHVLVDEFQDTNLVQYTLLKHLSSFHNNLFVVGDEDQSIYRWRGADYRNVLRFTDDYPKATKILLEENYRSTQLILDAATSVIDHNQHRTHKELQAARNTQGPKIILHTAYDDRDEGIFVVDTIRRLLDRGKAAGSDFAVMYRTNAQSRLIEEAFLKAGIEYRLVGAQRFYGRREIKDLIAYLRLVHNPDDAVSFSRIINVPKRGIGDVSLQSILLAAQKAQVSPGRLLFSLGLEKEKSALADSLPSRILPKLIYFGEQFLYWSEAKEELSVAELLETIIESVEYENYLEEDSVNRDTSIDRLANVHELRRLTYEYQESGLDTFLENMALVSDQDTLPENTEAPTLLTLHAAKGLEFPIVFIVGMDQDLLPHSRSISEPEELAEERRLFYVGITRAKDQLYLTRAERRSFFGTTSTTLPSEFLDDIPSELIEVAGKAGITRHHHRNTGYAQFGDNTRTAQSPSWLDFARPDTRRQPEVEPIYHIGMRVHHAMWGEGVVINSFVDDGEEAVDIEFKSAGIKKVLASIVKLDILDEGENNV